MVGFSESELELFLRQSDSRAINSGYRDHVQNIFLGNSDFSNITMPTAKRQKTGASRGPHKSEKRVEKSEVLQTRPAETTEYLDDEVAVEKAARKADRPLKRAKKDSKPLEEKDAFVEDASVSPEQPAEEQAEAVEAEKVPSFKEIASAHWVISALY